MPHVLPPINVPSQETIDFATSEIIDTSGSAEDANVLHEQLRCASVVVLVYGLDDPATFERVTTHWKGIIRAHCPNVPVVLVGNKLDLRERRDERTPLLNEVLCLAP